MHAKPEVVTSTQKERDKDKENNPLVSDEVVSRVFSRGV
jgi:hypothetical protein